MSRASSLYRLQEIDHEVDRLKGRLEEIQISLQDSAEITQLMEDLAAKEAVQDAVSTTAKRARLEVEDQRVKIQKTEDALYGGSVTNPKELEDLQMESEALKRYLETLEDRYIEAMLQQDEADDAVQRSSAALEVAEAKQAELHSDLMIERESIDDRLANLEAEREVAVASVSDEDQSIYGELRSRLSGVAVVALDGDSCGACGLTLSASTRQLVGTADELTRCTQCGRILYGG